MVFSINIIGAGNLGKTVGHLLFKQGLIRIKGICNRTAESTMNAIRFIGGGTYYPDINELPPAEITLIATPDDFISETCSQLSKNPFLQKGGIVLHCSGSLSSDALGLVKAKGCYVASAHPMRSFAKPELSIQEYKGTYCAIEGDREALPYVKALFDSIDSITYEIDKNKKTLYHLAGVFASNYLITLAEKSLYFMKESKVEHERAMRVIIQLMRSTVFNLEQTLSPKQALTGPIKRGDTFTILEHIKSLQQLQGKEGQLYSILAEETLVLTDHYSEKLAEIRKHLLL